MSLQCAKSLIQILAITFDVEVILAVGLLADPRLCRAPDHIDGAILLDVVLVSKATTEDVIDVVAGRAKDLVVSAKLIEETVKILG